MSALRRLARLLAGFGTPFLWLFAAIGAALIVWPAWGLEDAPRRAGGRIKVSVHSGDFLLVDENGDDHPAGPWHPWMLTVEWLGEPLPDDWITLFEPDTEIAPETYCLAFAYLDGGAEWYWPDGGGLREDFGRRCFPLPGFVTGTTAVGSREFAGLVSRHDDDFDNDRMLELVGPPHRLRGAALSLWPLLTAAGLIGAVRWRRAAGRRERGEPARAPGLPRRLVRPWLGVTAALGLLCVVGGDLEVGPYWFGASVVRGPADASHPRALQLFVSGPQPPGPDERPETNVARSAPSAGLWGQYWSDRYGRGAGGAVSLWYVAAACLLANGVTLWRRRRSSAA